MATGAVAAESTHQNLSDYKDTLLLEIHQKPYNRMYETRTLFTMMMTPGFSMNGYSRLNPHSQAILVSMPMYACYGNMRISEIPFERLVIKLKDPDNKEHIKQIKKAL